MLRPFFSRRAKKSILSGAGRAWRRHSSNVSRHEPLRILFCGADDFSIHSFDTLHRLSEEAPEKIQSIDVVCRPDKRVGRGLKKIQEVPIKQYARDRQVSVHQIDTFTGWSPPLPFNLVIAVSFGLLVPARILTAATYGGLNLHPSLLPDLRGAAPIEHALMKDRSHTGVSLQTMHPTTFDHGLILDQISEPIVSSDTSSSLRHKLGLHGAKLLDRAIQECSFVSPKPITDQNIAEYHLEHAPKITPEDRHLDWSTWSAKKICRYDRALSKLWDDTLYSKCAVKESEQLERTRITWDGPWKILAGEAAAKFKDRNDSHLSAGTPCIHRDDKKRVGIWTADGFVVVPSAATVAGGKQGTGLQNIAGKLANLKFQRKDVTP